MRAIIEKMSCEDFEILIFEEKIIFNEDIKVILIIYLYYFSFCRINTFKYFIKYYIYNILLEEIKTSNILYKYENGK